MLEKLFLARLAVFAFNRQYTQKYDYKQFDVRSIKVNNNSKFAYEIFTRRSDDFLRLRLYCNISTQVNAVGNYSLYDEANKGLGKGDEIFVADALVDQEFLYTDTNYIRRGFGDVQPDPQLLDIIMDENGTTPILAESNSLIYQERADPNAVL